MATLRTEETQKRYDRVLSGEDKTHSRTFDLSQENILRSFTHWVMIKNNFPYDLIAQEHELLIPKRVFTSFGNMNQAELDELEKIKKKLDGTYDMILEALPSKQTVPGHFHLHCIKVKEGIAEC